MANYSLTPYYENIIQKAIDLGIYANASETVRAGLRLLEKELERDARLLELKAAIAEGENSPDMEYDMSQVIARGKERRAKNQVRDENA